VSALLHALGLLRLEQRERPGFWALVLLIVLLALVTLSLMLGSVQLTFAAIARALADSSGTEHAVFWNVRLPRIALGALVGAALATSGALMQTSVRNTLADPGLLGVSAGAGLGALLGILFLPELPRLLPLFAFGGAFAVLAVVLSGATLGGTTLAPLRLILWGVGLQAMLLSCVALLMFLYADRAPAYVAFTVGSLGGSGWREVSIAALPVLAGGVLAIASVRPLDALLLDDDSAASVGLPVRWTRLWISILAAWLSAAAVSVAGMVGFVGLVVPNAVRLAAGPRHRVLLPLCWLAGAALVVAADLICRLALAPLELPVGALLALVGGPALLYLLWKQLP
jgi:iron complex transport system permease protein